MMLSASGRATRAFLFVKCPAAPKSSLGSRTHFDLRRGKSRIAFSFDSAAPFRMGDPSEGDITLQEWQGWGTTSPLPTMVMEIVEDLKALEKEVDANMSFGGVGGKLQGNLGIQEDKKHRVKYQALGDSEKKLQFYAARQIACRLLGSRGYLCQKCWLPMEDCMCSKVTSRSLGPGDFLRQNNTGKILWQVFGVEAATLCLFGIPEHEEIMWDSFKLAGKGNVWCLYPNKSAVVKSVQGAFGQELIGNYGITLAKTKEDKTLNFILIDGTWSNSAAMFRRLQDQANSIWGDEDLPCISLTPGASAMHKLRPQPSWDRTCTAAAAAGLLSELQLLPQFSSIGLDKQAEAVEDTLTVLLEALTTRRLRMGRSITRKVRHTSNIR
ncbi:uncharacterized protein LOC114762562 isoform X2 [Neltuma alba]|uniref:uncharacterized protein LOC114762501 isoform X2 n=1 Tax=Neltuma alba TaxID=207710 RepID=UPI0010A3D772|nr:uncharacterized protein LOC114762501 isoform X2 [Prosopis alba]XP_028807899.1 uncharacterized protein LOC114762562 isoform X2 [Prosopis alba]